MQAPSAANQQPCEFYVVTDKDKIDMQYKVGAKNAFVIRDANICMEI